MPSCREGRLIHRIPRPHIHRRFPAVWVRIDLEQRDQHPRPLGGPAREREAFRILSICASCSDAASRGIVR